MLTHKGTVTVETPRLILRKARIEDAEPMFRNWANDPEVTKFLTWPPHGSIEVTRKLLASWVDSYEKKKSDFGFNFIINTFIRLPNE